MSTEAFRMTIAESENMGAEPSTYPERVILWLLAFEEINGELLMFYESTATHDLRSSNLADFKAYLGEVLDGREPQWGPCGADRPSRSPLSIAFNQYAYHVFVLTDKRWRFFSEGPPFKVQMGKADYYLMARCAWRDASGVVVGETPAEGIDSTVAFFIADAHGDLEEHGEDQRTAFNIYVDLLMTLGGRQYVLPIAIDPDVGFPEGTNP